MKNDFFTSLKDGFADNIADNNYCKQLVDNYVTSLDCAGASCRGMNEIKKGFAYIVSKYKSLLKLKNQNEEIFSQILHDIKSPLLGVKYALEDKKRSELDDEIYKINLNALDLIGDFLLLYSFRDGYKKLNFYNFSPLIITTSYFELVNLDNSYNSFDSNMNILLFVVFNLFQFLMFIFCPLFYDIIILITPYYLIIIQNILLKTI